MNYQQSIQILLFSSVVTKEHGQILSHWFKYLVFYLNGERSEFCPGLLSFCAVLTTPNNISVFTVRSWASSNIIQVYLTNNISVITVRSWAKKPVYYVEYSRYFEFSRYTSDHSNFRLFTQHWGNICWYIFLRSKSI